MTVASNESVEKAADDDGGRSNTILSRKLKKLLESQVENDAETQDALRELSTFFKDNTLKNRRQLRGEIERRSLHINTEFLAVFQDLKGVLDEVHGHAKAMNDACQEMQAQLAATKSRTRDLIGQTTAIQNQARSVEQRTATINHFLAKYQLTADQEAALTSSAAAPVDERFFEALERSDSIHGGCKSLLASGRLTKQTTALEVMDQMSRFQESGMQRLYRWTQGAARSAHHDAAAAPSGLLAKAMEQLAKRPPLFSHVLEDYCASRRSLLVRAFLDALTVGGPRGTPKPIELHAHDPLRYVGDMLAWLHQTTPTEADNLRSLLKLVDEVEVEKQGKKDGGEIAEDCLCDITDGVCRPLRSRIEQILASEGAPVALYKLANLIRFYATTIESVVPSKSGLVKTLQDLDEMAYAQFVSVLQATVRQQTTNVGSGGFETTGFDLAPSQSTMALLSLLREILSSTSVMEEQQCQLEEIVNAVVDPLVGAIEATGNTLSTTDQDVYLLNSLYQIHTTLSLFKFNDAKLRGLEGEMQLHVDTLTSEQTSNLIANLELQPVCTMLAQPMIGGGGGGSKATTPLSQVKGMDAASLCAFMAKFDGFLVAPEVHLMPQIRLLVSSKHRKLISKRALQVVSASYKQLHEAVVDPVNQYENPEAAIVPKTPEQIDLLLQL